MKMNLDQLLSLVGRLDDTSGQDTSRERFRKFLSENVKELGQVRDFVEQCLRTPGDQYSRALQDLVNHLGHFLGFEVEFGRYQGVSGQLGYDGLWKSPAGLHLVVEVKTTEIYAIRTSTLTGYIDGLISAKRIPDWDSALGLYVVGRPDTNLRQLENAIIAEKRTAQLRVVSVNSLLSLAEIMNEFDVSHKDILSILRPPGPTIDPLVELMAGLVAQARREESVPAAALPAREVPAGEPAYWLTPVRGNEEQSAEEVVESLVGRAKIYAFGERTPGRRHLKPGDWICFYATGKGVVAHARVASKPKKEKDSRVRDSEAYPWVFKVDETKLYLNSPVPIDQALRDRLEAFKGKEHDKSWAWFVQATRRISEGDFRALTAQHEPSA
jgi:hypothetical protein